MPKLTIDGKEIEVEAGITLIQACELAGVEIPRFCYHERLAIAGNCRMCLVEVEKSPKPVASCAMPINEGMVVHTNSPMVKKAREGVMEFLLVNHPLDCPICDQGGECDLQDQAMAYGKGSSRFDENKRAVKDKYMGPLVETQMNRCIHCTRCVRFLEDVAGVPELGAIGRGEHMEITTYVEKSISSELSGNIIDLCPVGALTSKPYSYKARSWELAKTESIDVLDAVGSNIRVDARGLSVMRILPRLNEAINEEWISDKTRYACDGLRTQRLDRPMLKREGKLVAISWQEALQKAAEKLNSTKSEKIAAIIGDLVDCEAIFALKDLMVSIGCDNIDCRQDGSKSDATKRVSYLFNTTIDGIEAADLCLLVGANPRHEATVLNARIRKRYLAGGFKVSSIGEEVDMTYPVNNLGNDINILKAILDGSHQFSNELSQAEKPMLILGSGLLTRKDSDIIMGLVHKIAEKYRIIKENWNGFNLLQRVASRVGALDIGFVPQKNGKALNEILDATSNGNIEVVYLLAADEIDVSKLGNSFVIYQGHHGDKGAHRADLILPGATYTEKNATYVNLEGRPQRTNIAVPPPGEAKEDWQIIAMIAELTGKVCSYKNLSDLRKTMAAKYPIFAAIDEIIPATWENFGADGELSSELIKNPVDNYYMTDSISRASKTMAACTDEKRKNKAA